MKALNNGVLVWGNCLIHLFLDFSNCLLLHRSILIVLRVVILCLVHKIVSNSWSAWTSGRFCSFRRLKAAVLLPDRLISHFLHQCFSIDILFGDDTGRVLYWNFEMMISAVNFLHHSHHRLLESPRTHACQRCRCCCSTRFSRWVKMRIALWFERLFPSKCHSSERGSFGLEGSLEVGRRALVRLALVDAITHYHGCCRELIHSYFTLVIRGRRDSIIWLLELHSRRQHLISIDGFSRCWDDNWVLHMKGPLTHWMVLLKFRFSFSFLH